MDPANRNPDQHAPLDHQLEDGTGEEFKRAGLYFRDLARRRHRGCSAEMSTIYEYCYHMLDPVDLRTFQINLDMDNLEAGDTIAYHATTLGAGMVHLGGGGAQG